MTISLGDLSNRPMRNNWRVWIQYGSKPRRVAPRYLHRIHLSNATLVASDKQWDSDSQSREHLSKLGVVHPSCLKASLRMTTFWKVFFNDRKGTPNTLSTTVIQCLSQRHQSVAAWVQASKGSRENGSWQFVKCFVGLKRCWWLFLTQTGPCFWHGDKTWKQNAWSRIRAHRSQTLEKQASGRTGN